MNKNYKPRWIAELMRNSLGNARVMVLTGARQVGKTTLLWNEPPFSDWNYYDLDDFDTFEMAKRVPSELLAPENVVIDEVQRVPELLNHIRSLVDREPNRRIVLSGSANLALMRNVAQSLAGRAIYFVLRTMTAGEMQGVPYQPILKNLLENADIGRINCRKPKSSLEFMLWRGFLPPLMSFSQIDHIVRWWESYIMTYLERDLRTLSAVASLVDFRNVMKRLALSTGSLLNETEIARDTGVSQSTVHRYVNLLETSHVAVRLRGFYRSKSKRLIKRPKVYFMDTGLLAFLMDLYDPQAVKRNDSIGKLMETYVFNALMTHIEMLTPKGTIHYWREVSGREVDFVVEWRGQILPIEVKASKSISFKDFDNITRLMEKADNVACGVVIYGGDEIVQFGKSFIALPWYCL